MSEHYTEPTRHKASSLIRERSGKVCSKRICSLAFCFSSIGLAFCFLFIPLSEKVAGSAPEIIITFALLSGGTHYLTTTKHEQHT